jgi:flavin-dependent dehydrogenase
MSVTRWRLDEELLQRAAAAGVRVVRGCRVQGLEREGAGWRAAVEGAEPVLADAAFLATGKHDVRGRARPKGKQADLVAFKMYWRLAPEQAAALEGHVELMLYRGGYAGLQPVEEGAVNLCCLVERAELQRLGGRWEHLLAAMQRECGLLRERLQGAQALLERPLAVAAIPYGYVRAASDGVWALGDQAAVIPSFTGDGMSIALHSGCLAAEMYLQGETAERFQERLCGEIAGQVALATMVSRGLVWRPSRRVFMAAVGLWPGVLRVVAGRTRIAEAVMLA